MLKKICKTLPITVIFSVLTTSALAANSFSCEGAVAEVGIHGTNKVVLKLTCGELSCSPPFLTLTMPCEVKL